ncbi:Oxidoreductase, N-terminal [Spatholobus suberectus]|nr:Oxidoreductase, N-terminal [Spatholobus suberectus]
MRTGACDFTQKLLPLNITPTKIPLQRTPPFFLQPHRMAEAARTANTPAPHPIQPKPNAVDDKNPNPPEEVPPPPEKPDPGDCCGSGCVRCVWDVYYEELEQYNKLYKQDDPNPKPS